MASNDQLDNVIDVEAFALSDRAVPKDAKYKIRIDRDHYVAPRATMTGREILQLASKTPESYLLRQKIKGKVVEVLPDTSVSFTDPGVERFMTIPKEVQEGEQPLARQHFTLPQADIDYLCSLGNRWETIVEGGAQAILISGYELPEGYNCARADLLLQLTPGYPDTQIDMAYFDPPLARIDGKSIGGLATLQFDGRNWQRWSRHRTGTSAWRIGEDDVSTHLALTRSWLAEELKK